MKRLRLPAIISDIDGVLVRGKNAIKYSSEALNIIRQPLAKLFPTLFKESK